MSARSSSSPAGRSPNAGARQPRADDPRVLRSRKALLEAARALFLEKGYAGTTMEEIAERAGLTKRTVYNNYPDKQALFAEMVQEVIAFAEAFAGALRHDAAFTAEPGSVAKALTAFGEQFALAIVRDEVIALRRLLIGESRAFPEMAQEYHRRAPGQVMRALALQFRRFSKAGLLDVPDAQMAAAQFAYLVAGEALDYAMLAGHTPPAAQIKTRAREGVKTFLARYEARARR